MKKFGFIVLGLLLCVFFLKQRNEAKSSRSQKKTDVRITKDDKRLPIKNYEMNAVLRTEKSEKENSPDNPVNLQREPILEPSEVAKQAARPRVLEITFNEEVVAELESSWGDLRNQIQVTGEERGFRVDYLSDNSVFLSAGLQTGDLIPYEALNSMRNSNPEARQLAGRVVRIFEHVR